MPIILFKRFGVRLFPLTFGIVLFLLSMPASGAVIHFVYTSDPHYGTTRNSFLTQSSADASTVSRGLVVKINSLPGMALPADGGVGGGHILDGIDFVVESGDISNRSENGIQSAAASWEQFRADYIDGLTLKDRDGNDTPLYLIPGNHDVSNAIGFCEPLDPASDPTVLVEMFNRMISPPVARTTATFDYSADRIHYSKDIEGVHFVFVPVWPDSGERVWMREDMLKVSHSTPVIIFTHDEPDVPSKHFTNPNGDHGFNNTDKFENILREVFKDGEDIDDPSTTEQREFAGFIGDHPNITAYFHGHDNRNEFYTYEGPDQSIALNTFRVDSPMKGDDSGSDETKLSFQLVSIDTEAKQMTVRECLWDFRPRKPLSPIAWGERKTVSIAVPSVGVEENSPAAFTLDQNYPNPFNPSTQIHFSLSAPGHVSLTIFNALGQPVAVAASRYFPVGSHTIKWDAGDLASGPYICRLRAGNSVQSRRMLLVK